jgi:transposase
MTWTYCFIDDFLKAHPSLAAWRHSPNDEPAFTDAEVITLGLMQGCLGVATLKKTYQLIAFNFRDAFPHLCSYGQWVARLHALTGIVGYLIQEAIKHHSMDGRLYILDSTPIPLCKPVRHGRVRLLKEDGAYFGKNSVGWFFGFKLHLIVHRSGAILGAILTPANWDDRDPAVALAWITSGGVALADLGYPGKEFEATLLEEAGMVLITPKHATDPERKALISSLRERIETINSQLAERFVDRVRSRSWNGLWNTIKLKMVHLNLCLAGLLPA